MKEIGSTIGVPRGGKITGTLELKRLIISDDLLGRLRDREAEKILAENLKTMGVLPKDATHAWITEMKTTFPPDNGVITVADATLHYARCVPVTGAEEED